MVKKTLRLSLLVFLVALLMASAALAATTKYTFNDVVIDDQVVEIEAGVKETNKDSFTNCSYFSDDYREHLGYYQEAVSAGDTAEEVLAFCVANFDQRAQ